MLQKYIISIILITTITFCQTTKESASYNLERLQLKGNEALKYCIEKNFNTEFCVFIDMRIHSGLNRFFVWNFKQQSIIDSGLCSHGCCDFPWGSDMTKENPRFSNTPESHCSSLGKYKIGVRGYSQWGINVNYKLYGLDSSNSKAFARLIVLHSWNVVPEKEVFPDGTPEGWGCPAISNQFMRRLDKRLKNNKKPVLLWIFN